MMADYCERQDIAARKFIEYARETAGLTEDQAKHVLKVYRREGILKLDGRIGQFDISHGAFLDASALTYALEF